MYGRTYQLRRLGHATNQSPRRGATAKPRVSEVAQPRSAALGQIRFRPTNPEWVAQRTTECSIPTGYSTISVSRPGVALRWLGADPGLCCTTPSALGDAAEGTVSEEDTARGRLKRSASMEPRSNMPAPRACACHPPFSQSGSKYCRVSESKGAYMRSLLFGNTIPVVFRRQSSMSGSVGSGPSSNGSRNAQHT